MNIQWFPGHMAKTKRMIAENLKLVDIVVELLDARLPFSSQNPDIREITGDKPRLVLLNKCDLADAGTTERWIRTFRSEGIVALSIDSAHNKNMDFVSAKIREILRERLEALEAKGMAGRTIKMMVVGIPNVGKSSFINKLAGKSSTITGDRPGVTRGKQWVRLKSGMELLDTPGVLWPRFEDQLVGQHLAFIGSVKDEILDSEELGCLLLDELKLIAPEAVITRYKLDTDISGLQGYEILEMIGRKRGFVISGGEIDTLRAANILLDEFRSGKLGRITLEEPDGEEAQ